MYGVRSLELVQALQVGILWYRPHNHRLQTPIAQLIQLAVTIAREIGIDKYNSPFSINPSKSEEQFSPADAWRTWNICYHISALFSLCWRRPNDISWSEDDDARLATLEYGLDRSDSDRLLCQFVRAEKLCKEISSKTDLPSDPISLQALQNRIVDWKAQITPALSCPSLRLYEQVSAILLHESVLYTSTNKQSFAAPYTAERLSVTDFPAPIIVTQEQIFSIQVLQDACHATIAIVTNVDIMTIISLPMVFFTSRAMYAMWLLVKLYIAVTATGNTYGAVVNVRSLQIEEYFDKLTALGEAIGRAKAGSKSAVVPQGISRLRDWFWNYKVSYINSETWSDSGYSTAGLEGLHFAATSAEWPELGLVNDDFQFGIQHLFEDV